MPADVYGEANFAPVTEVDYADNFPVGVIEIDGQVRGYPIHILTFHEVVNDEFAGVPVVATYCPLCNTALAFDRRVGGETLDFGVSGNLRRSDLIMWDRQTSTWWQQATGEGIVGRLAGELLEPIAMRVISFGDFVRSYPDADILTEETGHSARYGVNPFPNYDGLLAPPEYIGRYDDRLEPLERVVALEAGGEALALSFADLAQAGVANVTVGGEPFAVFWAPGTASVLDDIDIATSQDIGAATAYAPEAGGETLTFTLVEPGRYRDDQTGSLWDVTGVALEGPFAGERLAAVPQSSQFWFAWFSFNPETEVWEPPAS